MLNLDETLELLTDYNIQRDLFLKCFLYSVGVIVIIDIVVNCYYCELLHMLLLL